jgi:hypothetical protein
VPQGIRAGISNDEDMQRRVPIEDLFKDATSTNRSSFGA